MQLPRSRFADSNTVWRQFFHLLSEVWEVFIALLSGNQIHALTEMVDVQISMETLKYIHCEKYNLDMEAALQYVILRGRRRGYWP